MFASSLGIHFITISLAPIANFSILSIKAIYKAVSEGGIYLGPLLNALIAPLYGYIFNFYSNLS